MRKGSRHEAAAVDQAWDRQLSEEFSVPVYSPGWKLLQGRGWSLPDVPSIWHSGYVSSVDLELAEDFASSPIRQGAPAPCSLSRPHLLHLVSWGRGSWWAGLWPITYHAQS